MCIRDRCCDIRIARPSAKFSNPEVMLGMVPGWMGIERVLNQVGPVVGRQMLMLGKRLTAQEAQAANLIDEVVEKEQVESWMANQLAQLEKCGPVALAHIKQLILALENKHADYPHQLLSLIHIFNPQLPPASSESERSSGLRLTNSPSPRALIVTLYIWFLYKPVFRLSLIHI